ncbi:unnamed protein product [Rhizophagus irregularis]|nr:unnamed protein product [Rhizophagus irregularis]CAB4403391.1 unnamed protein product [Rhizophagus irregularis]
MILKTSKTSKIIWFKVKFHIPIKIWKLYIKFNEFVKKKGVTLGQLCLDSSSYNMVVILGTRKSNHLEENVGAIKFNLSSEALSEIRQIINSIEIVSGRYNDA